MSRIIPSLNVESGIDPAGISHDPKEVEAYEKDPLINHRLTVRLATEMFNNQDKLLKIARDLKVACFFMHGTEDPISDPKGSEDFYNACASTDKELKLYPGLYHELFNELERQTVFQDVDEWLKARA